MSPTHVPDLTDDAVERALRADAEQWQASHPAPSLDDAVRRLLAEDRAPARHRSGWWRPVAVAAAVLLLIGGAVTLVSLRRHTPAPPASTTTAAPSSLTAGTLTVPGGFVEVSGHVSSPADGAIGRGHYGAQPQQAVRSWVSKRVIGTSNDLMPESLVLTVVGASPGPSTVSSSSSPRVDSSVLPDGTTTVTTATWVAGGREIALVYSGPVGGSADGRPLTDREVLAIALTYRPGSSTTPRSAVHVAVPVTVSGGPTSLVLMGTRALSPRRGPTGGLLVDLPGGLSATPQTATSCDLYAEAVLTGATASSVTVTVGVYGPTSGRPGSSCRSKFSPDRWVPVTLDEPLGSRTVIDGSTGRPVSLAGP